MVKNIKNKTLSGFIWRFLESCGAQVVTFIVSIVLARILDPVVFGTVALVNVFITLLQVFVESGLGTALVQKKDSDDVDFSTVFYFNLLFCLVLYVGIFFLSPVIANFYDNPTLTPVIRILSITIIISGVRNVQQAYVSKTMQFRKFFFSTIGATIVSAVVGIVLAYKGYGVWAIVWQNLFNNFVGTAILWITVRWRPIFAFSFHRLKVLLAFGWKMLVSGLLDTGYNEVRSLIIGKKYSSADLAHYNRGRQFPNLIVSNINGSINSVLLPTMAQEQENRERVKNMTRRAIKMSTYVIAPLMIGLAVCAEPIVKLVLTEKWLPCVIFLRIFCISYLFYPIHTANLNAIKAMGRSDMFLKLEIIKKGIGVALIVGSMWISVEAIAYSLLISTLASTIINAYPNKKLLKYSWTEQMKDILPYLGLATLMGGCVIGIGFIPLPTIAVLAIQVVVGAGIYIGISAIFKLEIYKYLLDTIKGLFRKKEEKKVKKILLLGGSRYLIPVINKAHELGYYVITCDYLPDNVAHKYSDEYHNVSIIEKQAVLELAKKLKIDGIMSFACDPGVVTAAYVAEELGLPFQCSYKSAKILQDKGLFRKFLIENNFNSPNAKSYNNIIDAEKDIVNFKMPVIVKPVDSAGSKGVTRVDEKTQLLSAIKEAIANSHNGKFIIEDFLTFKGYHSSADCFTKNGELVFCTYSDQLFDKDADNPYTPALIIWESSMEAKHQEYLTVETQRLMNLLGMETGIYNIETCVDNNDNPYIMEVSPRGGGCKIAEIQYLATGIDLIEAEVKKAVGEDVGLIQNAEIDGVWCECVIHNGPGQSGIFKGIEIDKEIKDKYVKVIDLSAKPGDFVEPFTGANKSLGDMFLRFDSRTELDKIMGEIKQWLKIILE